MSVTVGPALRENAATDRPAGDGRKQAWSPRLLRSAKIGLAVGLLMAGGLALLSGQGHVTTDNAVISAETAPIKAAMSGRVAGLALHVGDKVAAGTLIARLEEDRLDDQRLIDLRAEATRDHANHAAAQAERVELLKLRDQLQARVDAFNAAQANYARDQVQEAIRQFQSRAAHLEEAQHDLVRKATLGQTGDASAADVDHSTFNARAADHEAAAAVSRITYLQTLSAAAEHGLFLASGSNDVSYSAQRIDEVDLRLIEVARSAAGLAADEADANARLAAEDERVEMLRSADLRATSAGIVWRLNISDGERMSAGDVAAETVDCGKVFILASVPQEKIPLIQIGGITHFQLSGDTTRFTGQVIDVIVNPKFSDDRKLAAVPASERFATGVVRVGLGAELTRTGCQIGRTLRVLLPETAGGGVLGWIGGWFF